MANSIDESSTSNNESIQEDIYYETSTLDSSLNSEHVDKLEANIQSESRSSMESTSNDNNDQSVEYNSAACQFNTDKRWLDCQFHDQEKQSIKKPNELEDEMKDPPENYSKEILDRIQGSIFGMTVGDALGAHVEFRPRDYLVQHPVEDLKGGGTWGLEIGQFTDDTSMALCLANSLIARADFVPYDQLVRYKWWYRHGYMSSTGKCFDIGAATRQSLEEFEKRQQKFAKDHNISFEDIDRLSNDEFLANFDIFCSEEGVAGNGALMRLTPVPLFFYKDPAKAVLYSGISGKITHGDKKAYDACRYYGALIVAALHGETREQLLDKEFYEKHKDWFQDDELHPDILDISKGSYQKPGGYDAGIRGKGYIVNALEAALWAFWSDEDSFRKGACAAVNLGDDTDTTAAIYGQLAGAYYGYQKLPSEWTEKVYAKKFLQILSKWIAYQGEEWSSKFPRPLPKTDTKTEEPKPSVKKPEPISDDIKATTTQPEISSVDELQLPSTRSNLTPDETQPLIEEPESPVDEPKPSSTILRPLSTESRSIFEEIYPQSEESKPISNNLETPISTSAEIKPRSTEFISPSSSREFQTKLEEPKYTNNEVKSSTRVEVNSRSNFPEIEENVNQYPVTLPVHYTSSVTKESSCQSDSMRTIPVNYQPNISYRNDYRYGKKQEYSRTAETSFSSPNKPLYQGPNLARWSNNDVCHWIETLGSNYKTYIERFRKEKTDGFGLFSYVGRKTLAEFGVYNEEHQNKILDGIQTLKARHMTNH